MADIVAGSAPAAPAGSASPTPVASPTPTPTAPASASTPQSSSVPAAPAATSPGEPPQERWADILSNARQKAIAETEQRFRERYGKYDAFEQDPYGAVMGWLEQAQGHSQYGPQVMAWAANLLRSRRGQQQPAEPPKPTVPIVDAAGNITGYTYDADGLAAREKWFQDQLRQQWEQELGPVKQDLQTRAEREQQYAAEQQSIQWAADKRAQLLQNPLYRENEPRIKQIFDEHPEFGDNVEAAFNHFLVTEVIPNVGTAAASQAITQLTSKAGGNTVVPGTTVAQKPQFKNFREALEYFENHPEEAEASAVRR